MSGETVPFRLVLTLRERSCQLGTAIVLLVISLALSLGGCGESSEPRSGGEATQASQIPASVRVEFAEDVDDEQIEDLIWVQLSTPHPSGRGAFNLDGVRVIERHPEENSLTIEFFPGATKQEREVVLAILDGSPLIDGVVTMPS